MAQLKSSTALANRLAANYAVSGDETLSFSGRAGEAYATDMFEIANLSENPKKRAGFPDFESAQEGAKGVVFKAGLRSASDLGLYGTLVDTGALASFDAVTGYTTGSNASAILFQGMTNIPDLRSAGTLTFWCSSDIFDSLTTYNGGANSRFCVFKQAAVVENILFEKVGTVPSTRIATVSNITFQDWTGLADFWSKTQVDGSPGMVRVDITWDLTLMEIYLEYNKVSSMLLPPGTVPDLTNLLIGGDMNNPLTIAQNGYNASFFDVMLSVNPIQTPHLPITLNVNSYGDSFSQLRSYPGNGSGTRFTYAALPSTAPDGQSGTNIDVPSGTDQWLFPSIDRELTKLNYSSGLNPGGNNGVKHWAVGGSGWQTSSQMGTGAFADIKDRIDASVSGAYPRPDFCVFWAGYNDASEGAGTINIAAYEASIQAGIDAINLAYVGTTVIVILTTLIKTTLNDKLADRTSINTAIHNVSDPSINPNVRLIDMFTLTGGEALDDTVWLVPDQVHPSGQCCALYGREIAKVIGNYISTL